MSNESTPVTVRLDPETNAMIERHIGMRGLLGNPTNRSEVIRDALHSYLPPFEKALKEEVKKTL